MNKAQIAFASATLMFLLPSAAYPQVQTSSHKIRGSTCVNFRAEPSINAAVVNCLQPGTDVQVFRLPPTGRFVWVNDQAGRTWYKASVPGTNTVGWIMPACTDIFGNTTTEVCTDYGSVAQKPSTQQQNSPQNTSLAQNPRREEVLKNPNWQVVPGARVGQNPVDTLINVNNLSRQENIVTFDITGYQGFYDRLQGDCSTRQVRFLRRGVLAPRDTVNYRLIEGEEATKVFGVHRTALDFACRQTIAQIAPSTPFITTSSASPVQPSSQSQPPSTTQPSSQSQPPSSQSQPTSTTQPASSIKAKISSFIKPAKWWGMKGIIYPDAKQACEDLAAFRTNPLDRFELINFSQNGSPLNAICYFKNGGHEQTGPFCPTDGDYKYVGDSKGVCVLAPFVETVSPKIKPELWKEFLVTLGDLEFAAAKGLCNLSQRAISEAQTACKTLEIVYEELRPNVDYGCSRCVEVADRITDVLGEILGKERLSRPIPIITNPPNTVEQDNK